MTLPYMECPPGWVGHPGGSIPGLTTRADSQPLILGLRLRLRLIGVVRVLGLIRVRRFHWFIAHVDSSFPAGASGASGASGVGSVPPGPVLSPTGPVGACGWTSGSSAAAAAIPATQVVPFQ